MRWAWLLALLLLLPAVTSPSAKQGDLTISSAAPSAQPGSVVLVIVACRESPDRVVASALGREVVFYPDPDSKTWRGLVGVDVESAVGKYSVIVRAFRKGHPELSVTHDLQVAPKRFPTRRLNVAARYGSHPESAIPRIRQASESLTPTFQRVTPRQRRDPLPMPVSDHLTSNFGARSIFNGQPRAARMRGRFPESGGTPVRAQRRRDRAGGEPVFHGQHGHR